MQALTQTVILRFPWYADIWF